VSFETETTENRHHKSVRLTYRNVSWVSMETLPSIFLARTRIGVAFSGLI
jgi:hypothetical protein